jgi:cobyrinic acid a,c-diamide synthase
MGLITPKTVAEKLSAHLRRELSLDRLVAWAESAMMDGAFDPTYLPTIRDVVARIGVADVRAFDFTWDDCGAPWQTAVPPGSFSATPHRSVSSAEAGEQLLTQLGYSAQVSIVAR